ncbi:MAG: NAD(P)H-dependent oxidoreductase [Pseudomonadota bacterium]
MTKRHVLVFAASNSQVSINRKLAHHAGNVLCGIFDDDFELAPLDLNDYEMPIYSPERQATLGIPERARQFFDQITQADGVIVSFAEHNGSYAVAYKNVFDWSSRIDMKVYQDRPLLVLSASPGSRGAALVFKAATETLPFFGGNVVASYNVGSFAKHFDDAANALTTPNIAAGLRKSVHAFGAAMLLD